MAEIEKLRHATLQAICDVLADTVTGLTNSEIGFLLETCRISDPRPLMSKRNRLFTALSERQERDGCANSVFAFVLAAMSPVRFVNHPEVFNERQTKLNSVLAFLGYEMGDDAKIVSIPAAQTIDQAQNRAQHLKTELVARNVHPDVLRFCKAELVKDNYFHAVLEAAKSVAQKIRDMSGLTSDGAALVNEAFGFGKKQYPPLAFNSLQTVSEKSEQYGLLNLMIGFFGVFRNPTAHAPKILWEISERDALDMLTLASLLHRRLDTAVKTALL